MRYMVPKFINREAKVWGPLTFKEALIIGFLVFLSVILWYILPHVVFILVAPGSAILIAALLFVRIKGRSLLSVVTSYLWFFISPRIYVWKRKKIFYQITPYKKNKNQVGTTIFSSTRRKNYQGHLKDIYNKINLQTKPIKKINNNE